MIAVMLAAGVAQAQSRIGADQGKLLLTAGFSDVEGAGGGGLVPFAFITAYGTSDSWGANAHVTHIDVSDFRLDAYGVAIGALDRVELTFTRHDLDVTGTALEGLSISQDIIGAKVRLFGDAVYAQDSPLPQVALGAQYKKNRGIEHGARIGNAALVSTKQLGARDDDGMDIYLTATKLYLAQSLLVNLTVRSTKANQFGLLGFAGDKESDRSLEVEGSLGYVVSRKWAIGAEYRSKPSNLGVDDESDAWDIFVAWAPSKYFSLVGAYLNLGDILGPVTGKHDHQDGLYASLQVGF
jgi:hypothetical protein